MQSRNYWKEWSTKAGFLTYDCEMVRQSPDVEKRFHASYEKVGSCWIWTGSTINNTKSIYPILRRVIGSGVNGGRMRAHRLSYILFKADLPREMVVDHTCENKMCVNPEHLEAVTNPVNVQRYFGRNAVCADCSLKIREIVMSCKKREEAVKPPL